ncbi:MAG: hypothetical protein KGI50_06795 [Patescibacteria group bacterium]|nr:hypothetical protein [Patescibacteria group bacterium]MDE2439232.1 hypothetical protein [Patescibacteria group bacterium]
MASGMTLLPTKTLTIADVVHLSKEKIELIKEPATIINGNTGEELAVLVPWSVFEIWLTILRGVRCANTKTHTST